MSKIFYTFTISTAMLALSVFAVAESDGRHGHDDRKCEDKCEQVKERCERLKPGSPEFQACRMEAQRCKSACNDDPGDKDDRDPDNR